MAASKGKDKVAVALAKVVKKAAAEVSAIRKQADKECKLIEDAVAAFKRGKVKECHKWASKLWESDVDDPLCEEVEEYITALEGPPKENN